MRKIGENIRFYRNLRSLTQTALARKVDVAPAYISQIEANQRVPSLKVTRRVAAVLGIEMSVLVRDQDPRVHEGRLSDSEKLDLLRTLIMAIEGESREGDEPMPDSRSVETRECVLTEVYEEPSFSVILREFNATGPFGREIGELDVECHVVLSGRIRGLGPGESGDLEQGACRSLTGEGADRLSGTRGARVLSLYSPRVALESLVGDEAAVEARTGDDH